MSFCNIYVFSSHFPKFDWNDQVVSEDFEGKNMVARHRMIYKALTQELNNGLHALALKTLSPSEDKL